MKVNWDDELPRLLLKEWKLLLDDLREAISIPRSYGSRVEGTSHMYTACMFAGFVMPQFKHTCMLPLCIWSYSQVLPLKQTF